METKAESNTPSSTARRNRKKKNACQECHRDPSLYMCPRCSFRSCSLACCLSHKKRMGCNGKRDRTAYLPIARMTDSTLQSDYHFLEDVLHNVQGGKRLLRQTVGGAAAASARQYNKYNKKGEGERYNKSEPLHPMLSHLRLDQQHDTKQDGNSNHPAVQEGGPPPNKRQRTTPGSNNASNAPTPKWRRLVTQAQQRGVTLLLMPPGMERHKCNTTWYNIKEDVLYWRVEFCLHLETKKEGKEHNNEEEQTTVKVTAPKVSEHANLSKELDKLLQNNHHHNNMKRLLRSLLVSQHDEWHFLLKRLPCPFNQARYVELNKESGTLNVALRGMTVIEFPTIHVVLTKHLDCYPRIIEEVKES